MVPKRLLKILAVLSAALLGVTSAGAAQVRDLVTVAGAPRNQLVGYGLVVGLPGTGDQTTQVPYTQQAIENMLTHEGITLPSSAFMQPNDVASVMVTATVPAYASPGTAVNATVSAVGNATAIAGGVLLPTALRGGNGLVYAQAQGPILVSGFAAGAAGSSTRTNTPTVGRLAGGTILSREIPTDSDHHGHLALLLRDPSFFEAAAIAHAINHRFGAGTANAASPGRVTLTDPSRGNALVEFMAGVMNVDVTAPPKPPTVVVDAQSGTIVMGAGVTLGPAVVSHGALTVAIQSYNAVSQPAPFSKGRTTPVTNARVSAKQPKAHVVLLPKATTLGKVAAALNAAGATPADLIAIIEALKEAGSLNARLKVI